MSGAGTNLDRAEEEAGCAVCGRRIEPFGRIAPHRFMLEEGGELCLDCARTHAPDQVRAAELFERYHQERSQGEIA